MRRNVFHTSDTVRSNHNKLVTNETNVKVMMDMLREIKEEMKKFYFHIKMDSIDICEFFPLKSDDDLNRFMDKTHENWEMRRKGFNHLLYCTVTKVKRRFSTALLHLLFTRDFIANHKWPFPG